MSFVYFDLKVSLKGNNIILSKILQLYHQLHMKWFWVYWIDIMKSHIMLDFQKKNEIGLGETPFCQKKYLEKCGYFWFVGTWNFHLCPNGDISQDSLSCPVVHKAWKGMWKEWEFCSCPLIDNGNI